MTPVQLQVFLLATLVLGVSTSTSGSKEHPPVQPGRGRPAHVAGYPVERTYQVQEKSGSEETEPSLRSQQAAPERQQVLRQHYQNYARALEQQQRYVSSSQQLQEQLVRQQQQEEVARQQQQSQLLQQYQQYQQLQYQAQQQSALPLQQVPYQQQQIPQRQSVHQQQPSAYDLQQQVQLLQQQQIQQQQQLRAQQPQQHSQRQQQSGDSVASSLSFLGVKYSSAPAVAHTMIKTNNGVSISY